MNPAPALIGEGLRLAYRRSDFVLDVGRIEAPAGRTLAILGPSGSGKSTLLHVLGLLERPDAGRVVLDGREVTAADRTVRLSMAAVFQRPYLIKGSVGANVSYGLRLRGVRAPERRARVTAALERVGLAGYEDRSALSLSGGEAQRVSLARALVLEPKVLLVDEPLASLDPLLKRRLTHDFATILREAGVTVIYVTHDQDEAIAVADQVAIMNAGRIVAQGPVETVVGLAEDEWTAAFLGVEPATKARVVRSSDGTSDLQAGNVTVTVAGETPIESEVWFSVRPEDVLLFEGDADLPVTTARNKLKAQVTGIEHRGSTLRVTMEADGVRIASSVSRAAARDLALSEGSYVLAVFKATAVRWRMVSDED